MGIPRTRVQVVVVEVSEVDLVVLMVEMVVHTVEAPRMGDLRCM